MAVYLKYVSIEGFKSFPERNDLDLAPGTCVLVGANGTGKSNLTDAVSWVLGQDDLSTLRATGPADLTFAGSDELIPTEWGEVTAVLDHRPERETGEALPATVCKHGHKAAHAGDMPSGVLTITRRLYRDGRERWLLDGEAATLDDTRDALNALGVASPPVAVIRQGELERLLFLAPSERQHVIEAAADIDGLIEDLAPLVERREAILLRHEHLEGEVEAAVAQRERLLHDVDALRRAVALDAELADLRARALRTALTRQASGPADHGSPQATAGFTIETLLRLLGLPEKQGHTPDRGDAAADGDDVDGHGGHADGSGSRPVEDDPIGLEARLTCVLGDREALGPVNTRALLDLETLDAETTDLRSRLQDAASGLAAIDREIAEQRRAKAAAFAAAHRRVEDRFRAYYALLAPGGEAALPLVPTVGVDVVVRPPGKVLDQVSSLSGGERSLAALSLALAVFQELPSPLFVLDEVEPALDDANIRRLQAVLDRVADHRQLLLVSHQQRAKETGDVVFGVERNLDGASQVKYRYEPRTRKLDIFRRTWAADHLRRHPLEHGSGHTDRLSSAGTAGSPTQAALALSTPGPGAGPSRYRPQYFHEDGTFRGIWDAMGNTPRKAAAPEEQPADLSDARRSDRVPGTEATRPGDGFEEDTDDGPREEDSPPVEPCC